MGGDGADADTFEIKGGIAHGIVVDHRLCGHGFLDVCAHPRSTKSDLALFLWHGSTGSGSDVDEDFSLNRGRFVSLEHLYISGDVQWSHNASSPNLESATNHISFTYSEPGPSADDSIHLHWESLAEVLRLNLPHICYRGFDQPLRPDRIPEHLCFTSVHYDRV